MLEGMIVSLISLHKTVNYKMGRANIDGVSVVSGGLLAKKSEIVVDDCNDPKKIYGVGNGIGDFEVELDEKVKNLINLLNRKIQNQLINYVPFLQQIDIMLGGKIIRNLKKSYPVVRKDI